MAGAGLSVGCAAVLDGSWMGDSPADETDDGDGIEGRDEQQ